jgi:OmpA-OmpF porin, OOP family
VVIEGEIWAEGCGPQPRFPCRSNHFAENIMKTISILVAAAATGVMAAGCTTASGPAHNTNIVTLPNGAQAFQVQCSGLFEGSNTCFSEARKICGDKPVQLIGAVSPAVNGGKLEEQVREITFNCAVPAPAVVQQPVPQAAPVPAPAPAPVKMVLQGDANFATGSAVLMPVAQQQLDQFIGGNRGIDLGRVTISGYTDSTGSAKGNQRLSEERASSVQQYLVSHGVRAASYSVRGYGSAAPVASNATAAGRALNRRVEVQVAAQ